MGEPDIALERRIRAEQRRNPQRRRRRENRAERAPDAPTEPAYRVAHATTGQRIIHLVVDVLGVAAVSLAIQIVASGLVTEGYAFADLAVAASGLLAHFFYYLGFEGFLGRTPAKWITGTEVVTLEGARPGFGAVALRTLVRVIPFEPFSFLGPNDGWHDRWSKTRVVRRHRR